jgi:hypothetical protein
MIRRWTALGIVTAENRFKRIKGYRHMGDLVRALKSKQNSLDSVANVCVGVFTGAAASFIFNSGRGIPNQKMNKGTLTLKGAKHESSWIAEAKT